MESDEPIDALLQRAQAAGFETESREISYRDEVRILHSIFFREGEKTRRISIGSSEEAEELRSIEFERFVFLSAYDAIADLERGYIEASISSRDLMGSSMIERRLGFLARVSVDEEFDGDQVVEQALICCGPDGVQLEISQGTEALRVLTGRLRSRPPLSLKISFGNERSYDAALNALETVSNSLFFQLDMETGVALSLRKAFYTRRISRPRHPSAQERPNIQFPAFEYDSAPIALYWYAKSARGMPLLQFLAYYQVAEYYFPNFAKLEAVRGARKVLKNPTFRVDRESDLIKLIHTIAGNGRVGSSEREQMKATVLEVLTNDDVVNYFKDNEAIAEIVGKKHKLITDKTINTNRKDHDHRADIAEMLYDIRCRIVHTKNDSGDSRAEMLLPFSTAEDQLWPYIDVMRFVAQNALIRSSSVLRPL